MTGPVYRGGWGIAHGRMLSTPEERRPYEEDLANSIRDMVRTVREFQPSDDNEELIRARVAAGYLLDGLRDDPETQVPTEELVTKWGNVDFPGASFAALNIERGIYIGGRRPCYEIGVKVCAEMNFSAEEAEKFLQDHPRPERPEKQK